MYFFDEPRDIEYFDGTTAKQKYDQLRKIYYTTKEFIKTIYDDIAENDKLYTSNPECFNRRIKILKE